VSACRLGMVGTRTLSRRRRQPLTPPTPNASFLRSPPEELTATPDGPYRTVTFEKGRKHSEGAVACQKRFSETVFAASVA
jgi:hypothetical protein